MKLREWNELLDYGKLVCQRLKDIGVDAKIVPYSIYNGNRGLRLVVCDSNGEAFAEFSSGIGTFEEMRLGLTVAEIEAKKL